MVPLVVIYVFRFCSLAVDFPFVISLPHLLTLFVVRSIRD